MVLTQDFREFFQSLNEHNVRYLVIGGYAVAFHGHPRYTKDIDVWIEADKTNAEKLIDALRAFGFGSLGLEAEDCLDPDEIIQLGYPPNRINLLTALKGVDFDTCYASRIVVEIQDTSVNFIDLENLKKNKRATGRLQDLADLEHLK